MFTNDFETAKGKVLELFLRNGNTWGEGAAQPRREAAPADPGVGARFTESPGLPQLQ